MTYSVKRGDTHPPVEAYLFDENGPVPLQGASIRFLMAQVNGVKRVDGVAEAIDAADLSANPNVRYVWRGDGTDTDTAGVFRCEWEVTFAPGTIDERRETFPSDEWEEVIVREDLGGTG